MKILQIDSDKATNFYPHLDITFESSDNKSDLSMVEIDIREDKKVIWVSIAGTTVLRICRISKLFVNGTQQ